MIQGNESEVPVAQEEVSHWAAWMSVRVCRWTWCTCVRRVLGPVSVALGVASTHGTTANKSRMRWVMRIIPVDSVLMKKLVVMRMVFVRVMKKKK